jgi:SAM-dependent methyltransferase
MAEDFLNISYFSPIKISRQNIVRAMRYAAQKYARGKMIDVGCGCKPYQSIFQPYVDTYFGIDYPPTAAMHYGDETKADLFVDCTDTKLEANSYDTILSTQVIEHIYNTEKYIDECYRILKKGGIGIFTIPFLWQCHAEPFDYYRFTRYSIYKLFYEKAFEILELKPLEGAYAAIAQAKIISVCLMPTDSKIIKLIQKLLILIYIPIINFCALHYDKYIYNDKLCLNYLLVVRK